MASVRQPMQARSQQNVETLLETASKLLSRHSAKELRASQIAREARLNISTLYRYFGNTDDLLSRLPGRFALKVTDAMAPVFLQVHNKTPEEAIPVLVRSLFALLARHRHLVKELNSIVRRYESDSETSRAYSQLSMATESYLRANKHLIAATDMERTAFEITEVVANLAIQTAADTKRARFPSLIADDCVRMVLALVMKE